MERSYLTHPKIVGAAWEGVLMYPVLWLLSDDGRIERESLDPIYLSAITRVPVGVVSAGITALTGCGVLNEETITACFSRVRACEGAPRAVEAVGLQGAGARPGAHAREGLEEYLAAQWGKLIDRGKPLAEWIVVQQAAHPEMDLLAEAKKARAWEMSQKKPKSAIRRFLAGWFNRAAGYKEETKIRAEGGVKHWSGMNKRERDKAVQENRHEHSMVVDGISITRDLRDDMFVLSGQDMTTEKLPFRGALSAVVRGKLNGNGDPYDPDPLKQVLKDGFARAESDRALTWAVDQIVTDVRYELGLLPV
jgi:hypothetical protein